MSKGKGKEKATEPDWKERIAMLDQQFGWDDETISDWLDKCEAEKQESTENGGESAFQTSSDALEDDEIMSPDMQQRIWDAAVEASRSSSRENAIGPCEGPSKHAILNDDQDQVDVAQQEQMEGGNGSETAQEESCESDSASNYKDEDIQPKSALAAYIYHRFGKGEIRYENRCSCHEHLRDHKEIKRRRTREYREKRGKKTNLLKDPYLLLPYKQADLPGTENVDKPVLVVTNPEGEMLFPHDLVQYPGSPAISKDETPIGLVRPLAVQPKIEGFVPYDEEDTPDW